MAEFTARQTPTQSVILPYSDTEGIEAVELYERSGRKAIEWQQLLVSDIMALNEDGLWTHQKFGYEVPRRNGKGEVLTIREFWGLEHGEKICHTAHRTTTSHAAWVRLVKILTDAGYEDGGRKSWDELPERSFKTTKQYGLESIILGNGGEIVFRTRTPSGGLGEGFDLLVIDEAQEYTDTQESALIYTVSDSPNPQTIFCGTPPTAISSGTVFLKLRNNTLAGDSYDTGWAEWSIPDMTDDIHNVALWYETNPSMGYHLDERKIRSEIRGDTVDFNIQRLGVWIRYNQKSAISKTEWELLQVETLPKLKPEIFIGIKYGHDGNNVSMAVAAKTEDGKVFVEAIDCRPIKSGNMWMLSYLSNPKVRGVIVDGANGQAVLSDEMKDLNLKLPMLTGSKDLIAASSSFEQAIANQSICHKGQPSLTQAISNCEHRAIGTNGGYGYKTLKEAIDVTLVESTCLAYWICSVTKERKKQTVSY